MKKKMENFTLVYVWDWSWGWGSRDESLWTQLTAWKEQYQIPLNLKQVDVFQPSVFQISEDRLNSQWEGPRLRELIKRCQDPTLRNIAEVLPKSVDPQSPLQPDAIFFSLITADRSQGWIYIPEKTSLSS